MMLVQTGNGKQLWYCHSYFHAYKYEFVTYIKILITCVRVPLSSARYVIYFFSQATAPRKLDFSLLSRNLHSLLEHTLQPNAQCPVRITLKYMFSECTEEIHSVNTSGLSVCLLVSLSFKYAVNTRLYLCYKPESRWFESQWRHSFFQCT
jgi:hypothetical protein